MTKRAVFLVISGVLLLSAGVAVVVKALFLGGGNGPAAVQVNSFPKADVYIDGNKVGQTPLSDEKQTSGEHVLKLVANTGGQNLEWTGKIRFTPDALTYINRELGPDTDSSAGEILFLEKLAGGDKSEIVVISDPVGATIKLDGNPSGQTPITIKDILPSDHEIAVSAPGYKDRFVRGKTIGGYRLNASVQLAKSNTVTAPATTTTATPSAQQKPTSQTATQSATVPDKPYVIIKSTPTGWLRVRQEPTASSTEVGRVNPGDKLPMTDEEEGWVKIKYSGNNEGWVSDAYVTKVK